MLTNLFAPALLYLYRRLGIISNINQDLNKWPGDQGENYLLRLGLTSHPIWKPGAQLKTLGHSGITQRGKMQSWDLITKHRAPLLKEFVISL